MTITNLKTKLEIGGLLGEGAFGKVYSATDPIHGTVAVKVLNKLSSESDNEWHERKNNLLQEGQRLKDAMHDNVVGVLHLSEDENSDSVYLAMEYCDGGCLGDDFELGPMLLRPLRDALTEAAFGLQAIHARGMLHRDIKPSNLLRNRNTVRIGDFGLVTNNIQYGYASLQGYIDHLAPEVINSGITSVTSDIWAFGMTAYRLLHGKKFYEEGPRPRSLLGKGNFVTHLPWLPHIPKRWKAFIRRALHDDQKARFQSATQLIQALAQLPIAPDWYCDYKSNEVTWIRETDKNRYLKVLWRKTTQNLQEWEVKSYPKEGTKGITRRIAGSNGVVDQVTAERELTAHFEDFWK